MSGVAIQAPDWEGMQSEVNCPLCEYNLRGLSEPRCPECGYTFTWDEILDKNRRHHPYIFEHHRNRNFWSFLKTVLGGLRPRRFWTELHPLQPSYPRRLTLYFLIIILAISLPVAIDAFWHPTPKRVTGFWWGGTTRAEWGWYVMLRFPLNFFSWPLRAGARDLLRAVCGALVALPVLNYILLMIFRQTMRRAQVGTHHVRRCVIYSADALLWPVLPLCGLVVINKLPAWAHRWEEEIAWTLIVSFVLIWLVMIWRLVCAYRHYLRFDHPLATILSVQLMIFLLLLLIL